LNRSAVESWLSISLDILERSNFDREIISLSQTYRSQLIIQYHGYFELHFIQKLLVILKMIFNICLHPFSNIEPNIKYGINKRILFWPFQPSHWKVQAPIYQRLKDQSSVISNNRIQNSLIEEGLSVIPLIEKRRRIINIELIKIAWKILALKIDNRIDNSRTFKIIFLLGLSKWYYLTRSTGVLTKMILEKLDLELIVVGNETTIVGNTLVGILNDNKKKSVSIMHGDLDFFITSKINVNKFFLFGDFYKNALIRKGVEDKRLCVSGSPALDFELENNMANKEEAQIILKSFGEKYILIALSGPGHSVSFKHHFEVTKVIVEIARKMSFFTFVVKLHRKDRKKYYSSANGTERPANLVIIPYNSKQYPSSIYSWLKNASALISISSTAVYDGMLMKVPVFSIDLQGESSKFKPISEKITIHSTSREELGYNLKSILANDQIVQKQLGLQNKFVKYYYANAEYNATDVIVDNLRELLK